MSSEFKFGLITGVVICMGITAEHFLGLHASRLQVGGYTGYFLLIVPFITLFLLLRGQQTRALGRDVTFKRSMFSGILASFLAGLIVYSFMLVYSQWINPYWVDNALAAKVALLRDQRVDEIEIRRKITFYRNATSPVGLIGTAVFGLMLLGGIISFAFVLLLRLQSRPESATP